MIKSHVKLLVDFWETAPERVSAKWNEMLKANASRIKQGIDAVIANEADFRKKLAGPASQNYALYVPTGFISRRGLDAANIRAKHFNKLSQTYQKYSEELAKKFETVDGIPAKRFQEEVDLATKHYQKLVGRTTLGLTGLRLDGRGPAAIAGLWLSGDKLVLRDIRPADKVLEGGPYLITRPKLWSAFKAALTGRLTQGGVIILQHEFEAARITEQNDLVNVLVQSYVDPALGLTPFTTGGLSHVDFQMSDSKLYLDIQVDQV